MGRRGLVGRVAGIGVVAAMGVLAGCNAPGGGTNRAVATTDLAQRVVPDATPEEVLAAAGPLLQREFGQVQTDRANNRITTAAVEFTTRRESGSARDLVRGASVMRRRGLFMVSRSAEGTVARLRIDVERRDTERQQLIQPMGMNDPFGNDSPGRESPIDRDAALTREQSAVWTLIRRDRTLERALLDELRDEFARRAPAEEERPATNPAAR